MVTLNMASSAPAPSGGGDDQKGGKGQGGGGGGGGGKGEKGKGQGDIMVFGEDEQKPETGPERGTDTEWERGQRAADAKVKPYAEEMQRLLATAQLTTKYFHEVPSGLLPGGSARHNEASRGLKRNDPVGNLGKDPSGLPLDGPTSAQAGAVPYDSCPTEHIQHRSSHALHGPANRACVTAEVPPLLRWLREQRCEFAYVTLQQVGCIELDDLRHFTRTDVPWLTRRSQPSCPSRAPNF